MYMYLDNEASTVLQPKRLGGSPDAVCGDEVEEARPLVAVRELLVLERPAREREALEPKEVDRINLGRRDRVLVAADDDRRALPPTPLFRRPPGRQQIIKKSLTDPGCRRTDDGVWMMDDD